MGTNKSKQQIKAAMADKEITDYSPEADRLDYITIDYYFREGYCSSNLSLEECENIWGEDIFFAQGGLLDKLGFAKPLTIRESLGKTSYRRVKIIPISTLPLKERKGITNLLYA